MYPRKALLALLVSLGLTVAFGLGLAACKPSPSAEDTAAKQAPAQESVAPAAATPSAAQVGTDPKNATYSIDSEAVTLVNGEAQVSVAPDSASKLTTRYLGDPLEIDLNGDARMDSVALLTQDGGGSGTLYYVAAALNTAQGYVGSNALFIGDRIAPQTIKADPNSPGQFVVHYKDRKENEPMSLPPTKASSKVFKLGGDVLIEVPASSAAQ